MDGFDFINNENEVYTSDNNVDIHINAIYVSFLFLFVSIDSASIDTKMTCTIE